MGALIRSRFGDEVLEWLVDPLVGGINAGDTDRLSLRASVPQLAEAAMRSGSLVEGLRAAPPAAGGPMFWAHPDGMGAIVDVLVTALKARRVAFAPVAVEALSDLDVDRVVIAAPSGPTAALVGGDAGRVLRSIGHSSPVLVTLAFRREHVRHPLDASGFLVPRVEKRLLTACSFATTKWAHLATDPSMVVLRASAGRYGDDRAINTDDGPLLEHLLTDLDVLLGIDADPLEVRVSRWRNGFPQYEPGHLDRVAAIEADVAERLPHVRLAGATYRGIGIPACIRSGREAARALLPA